MAIISSAKKLTQLSNLLSSSESDKQGTISKLPTYFFYYEFVTNQEQEGKPVIYDIWVNDASNRVMFIRDTSDNRLLRLDDASGKELFQLFFSKH
ncbi:MAG: hypothetical protein ACTJHC_08050 [Vagococcus sp.]